MGQHDTGLLAQAAAILPGLVKLRRAIHAEPELGLHNPLTTQKILADIADLPLEIRQGPSTTGVMAILRGARPGRTVLLRGDTDALPMPEDTDLDYKSRFHNVMHACGHDTHAAMLAGAARLLSARQAELAGTVMFMFQPGEEGYHGARFMMDDGLLDDPAPEAAFALHIMPNAPHGVFTGRAGPLLASADKISIWVDGKGGHASQPHDCTDPIPIACEIVSAIQAMVTRTAPVSDPAVVTVAKIEAGTTNNVIPESAYLHGTMRTLSERRRDEIQANLRRLANGISAAHGATARVEFERGFPVTICDGRVVDLGAAVVTELFGEQAWLPMAQPLMGAEDFAYVLQKVPGAMFFLGASHEGSDWRSCCPVHSNRMVLDDSVMARGAALHAAVAERFLARGFN